MRSWIMLPKLTAGDHTGHPHLFFRVRLSVCSYWQLTQSSTTITPGPSTRNNRLAFEQR